MTLSSRNVVFKAEIAGSVLILTGIIAASFTTLPLYGEMLVQAVKRPPGLFQALISQFLEPAPLVSYAVMIAAAVYSLVTIALIFYFFEKTQAPEILFITFFAVSFAFEAARLIAPLRIAMNLPGFFLVFGHRVIIFGRYFGLFSLFTASVCAAGLELQRQGTTILIILLCTLVIALGIPVDSFSWDSSLCMIAGYNSMFMLIETAVILFTAVNFIVASRSRGSREYILIGLGSFLALVGRNWLLRSDTWLTPLPGLLVLALGTWFICRQLHRVYLWL
jgi:hypothetical protein